MKKTTFITILVTVISSFFFTSCEKMVGIDMPPNENDSYLPRDVEIEINTREGVYFLVAVYPCPTNTGMPKFVIAKTAKNFHTMDMNTYKTLKGYDSIILNPDMLLGKISSNKVVITTPGGDYFGEIRGEGTELDEIINLYNRLKGL